jgi:ATP-dependent Clp protease ATP-binding subunit ClpA
VTVDLDDKDQIKLDFSDGDSTPPPAAPQETLEVE